MENDLQGLYFFSNTHYLNKNFRMFIKGIYHGFIYHPTQIKKNRPASKVTCFLTYLYSEISSLFLKKI
jgi:hypothetical protein